MQQTAAVPQEERARKVKDSKWKLTQRVASNIIVVFAGIAFFLALSKNESFFIAAQ